MTIHGWKEFTWDGWDLMFQGKPMATLIPHKDVLRHYHIKFSWRDEPTAEFFNIVNAMENARIYSVGYVNKDVNEARRRAH